jgi:peptidoglycan/LPS O-acetylase OafA/YrhL
MSRGSGATSHGHTPSSGSRLDGIEGLRALAAISVLLDHAWGHAQNGHPHYGAVGAWLDVAFPQGLTLFFALSGFLLYRPFAAAILDRRQSPSVRAYFWNRALRIVPGYWVIFILVALVFGAAVTQASNSPFPPTGYLWGHPGLIVANLAFVQNYFPSGILTGISPAWSLAAEIIFYILLPVLATSAMWIAQKRGSASRAWIAMWPAFALLVIGAIGNKWAESAGSSFPLQWGPHEQAVLWRSFLTNADLFAPGAAAAVVLLAIDRGAFARFHRVMRLTFGTSSAIVCVLAVIVFYKGLGGHHLSGPAYALAMSVASALLILYVTVPSTKKASAPLWVFRSSWATYVGTISYSVYLWHYPVITWLHAHGLLLSGRIGFLVDLAFIGLVTGVLSTLTYRFVEQPAMAKKRRLTPRAAAIPDAGEEASLVEAAP